jgi:hypothetical protein
MTPTTFTGRAIGMQGAIVGVPITLVDTGPADVTGDSLETHLLCSPDGLRLRSEGGGWATTTDDVDSRITIVAPVRVAFG